MEWYKVIVLNIDVFESVIEDERHFSSRHEADEFVRSITAGHVGVVVEMG